MKKFKVWDAINKEWFDETMALLSQDGKLHFWNDYKKTLEPMEEKTYIPVFSIGLKDKNGKEIFEGDLLEEEKGYYFLVEYGSSIYECGFRLKAISKAIQYPTWNRGSKMSIIGNIYENPELIKL